jgi:hypothetical protein
VKAPAAKFGRSNRLGRASSSCAEGVPGAPCHSVRFFAVTKRTMPEIIVPLMVADKSG